MPTPEVQTFRADNPRAALAAVKAALGPEAVILATRELKGGFLKNAAVEVVAAPPAPSIQEAPRKSTSDVDRTEVMALAPEEKTESIQLQPAVDAARAMQSRRARAAFGPARTARRKKKQNPALFASGQGALADLYADNPFASAPFDPRDTSDIIDTGDVGGETAFEENFFSPPTGSSNSYGDLAAPPLHTSQGPSLFVGEHDDDRDHDHHGHDDHQHNDDDAPLGRNQANAIAEKLKVVLGHAGALPMSQATPMVAPPIAAVPMLPSQPPAQSEIVSHLIGRGVPELLAEQLTSAAARGDEEASIETLRHRLAKLVRTHVQVARAPWSPDATGQRDVVALIGPTGVGKTTTIAKIAARAIMEFQLKVSLITVDTYRIGAAQQLARYGELLGAPTFVARDRAGLAQAMERSETADLILIDTAGRSSTADVAAQASLLRSIREVQMHLVVSATSSVNHLARVKTRFAVAEPERTIVTKLDEGDGPACFLAPVLRFNQPLSCVTFGQRVPEDLDAFSPGAIVSKVVGS